jgi:hypothetical protein
MDRWIAGLVIVALLVALTVTAFGGRPAPTSTTLAYGPPCSTAAGCWCRRAWC